MLHYLSTSVPERQRSRLVEKMDFGPLICNDCGQCVMCDHAQSQGARARSECRGLDLLRAGIPRRPGFYVQTILQCLVGEWQENVRADFAGLLLDRMSVGDYVYAYPLIGTSTDPRQMAILKVINKATRPSAASGCAKTRPP